MGTLARTVRILQVVLLLRGVHHLRGVQPLAAVRHEEVLVAETWKGLPEVHVRLQVGEAQDHGEELLHELAPGPEGLVAHFRRKTGP